MPSSSAGEILGNNNHEPASLPVKQDSPTAPPVTGTRLPQSGRIAQSGRADEIREVKFRELPLLRRLTVLTKQGRTITVNGLERSTSEKLHSQLQNRPNWIVIDCPPGITRLNADAIRVADVVLIPCKPRVWDAWACEDIVAAVKLRQDANRGWQRGVYLWRMANGSSGKVAKGRQGLGQIFVYLETEVDGTRDAHTHGKCPSNPAPFPDGSVAILYIGYPILLLAIANPVSHTIEYVSNPRSPVSVSKNQYDENHA